MRGGKQCDSASSLFSSCTLSSATCGGSSRSHGSTGQSGGTFGPDVRLTDNKAAGAATQSWSRDVVLLLSFVHNGIFSHPNFV